MVMRTPAYNGILVKENKQIFFTPILYNYCKLHFVNPQSLPAHREQIESYGAANDLLHVWADDC